MAKRMILMLVAAAIGIGALGFVKYQQIQAAIAQGAAYRPPPEAVTTMIAREEKWPVTLSAIGTMDAVQGVTVSADLPGIVDKIAFESGMPVNEGDVLVELDTRQEKAQLAAAEAERDLARLNFNRLQGLVNRGAISQADYDNAIAAERTSAAAVQAAKAAVQAAQINLGYATVRSPIDGRAGKQQAGDKGAARFFAKDITVRQAPLAEGFFYHLRQTARDAAEEAMTGVQNFVGRILALLRRGRQGCRPKHKQGQAKTSNYGAH